MSEPTYIPGELARIFLVALNTAGQVADPGALRLMLKAPASGVTTYTYGVDAEVVRESEGRYHADIQVTAAGIWPYRWELDAPNAGAVEGVINVLKSRVI